jgi:hypothetical protein
MRELWLYRVLLLLHGRSARESSGMHNTVVIQSFASVAFILVTHLVSLVSLDIDWYE